MTYTGRRKILCDEPESGKRYCVYCHTSPGGKKYIGITGRKPEHRWLSDGGGYKTQPIIWAAIRKYGFDSFEHEILLDGLTEAEAKEAEICLIKTFRTTDRKYGYNRTDGGESMRGENSPLYGVKRSEESKARQSAAMLGRKHSDETKDKIRFAAMGNTNGKMEDGRYFNQKNIICMDIYGNFVAEYNSIGDAARAVGGSRSSISECCIGNRKTHKGCLWKYSYEQDYKQNGRRQEDKQRSAIGIATKKRMQDPAQRQHMRNSFERKQVEQYSLDGKCIASFDGIREAGRQTGVSPGNISLCCRGKVPTARGYVWKYA